MTVTNQRKSTGITFAPLPPKKSGSRWSRIAAELKARPNEWACIGVHSSTTAWRLRHGHVGAMPLGQFEVTTRSNPDVAPAFADVWVRYVGPR